MANPLVVGPPPEPEKDPPPNSTGAYVGAFLPMIVFMGLGVAFGLALEFDVVDSIYFAFATWCVLPEMFPNHFLSGSC